MTLSSSGFLRCDIALRRCVSHVTTNGTELWDNPPLFPDVGLNQKLSLLVQAILDGTSCTGNLRGNRTKIAFINQQSSAFDYVDP